MKILLTGHMSYNLMAQFYPLLKQQLPTAKISLYGLNRPGGVLTKADYDLFDEVIPPPLIEHQNIRRGIFGLKWLSLIGKKEVLELIKSLFTFKLKAAYDILYTILIKHYKDEMNNKQFSRFDIINIHYLSKGNLAQLKHINEKHKLILSFWGSDLFQETGKDIYGTQLDALNRADAVTLHTHEMEQIFLSKFGRHLKNKVHRTIFGCDQYRLKKIDELRSAQDKIETFRNKFKIPKGKLVVQIGYSGGAGHYHFPIIESLSRCADKLKDEIFLLIPTTYNNQDKEYYEKLKNMLQNSTFDLAHITTYLSDEEVLLLPLVVDVHINVRDADALNNSMVEALYSGCFLVAGAWLPYGVLIRKGINFAEVESIDEIATVLLDFIEKTSTNYNISNNPKLIESNFTMQHHIGNWANLFKEHYNQ